MASSSYATTDKSKPGPSSSVLAPGPTPPASPARAQQPPASPAHAQRPPASPARAQPPPASSPARKSERPRSADASPADKVGPTLSTSTSSFEALDSHDPQLNRLATLMFTKTSDWISGELDATAEDYRLLEQMNRVTATKYSDMRQITGNVAKGVAALDEKYVSLQPYLDQIDQIDESVGRLEQAAFKLDAYSKRLEAKFKALEKRN